MNEYYFDLHSDIVSRQGKICAKCKRSLILSNKISVINDRMYCGKCGNLESKKASLLREMDSIDKRKKPDKISILKARANYDRVRKN